MRDAPNELHLCGVSCLRSWCVRGAAVVAGLCVQKLVRASTTLQRTKGVMFSCQAADAGCFDCERQGKLD